MVASKIQIRSFVKGGNHGQYLQALGLAEVVKSILPESEVSHLNYNNHAIKELYWQGREGLIFKYFSMKYFWWKRLSFTSFQYNPDISIYGSDMIWHLESYLFPRDKVFFGQNDNANRKIAYAPSVGYRGKDEPGWIKKSLDDFSAIAVRDEVTKGFVRDHTGRDCQLVIDPCFFLLDSPYKERITSDKRQNIISVYSTIPSRLVKLFEDNQGKMDVNHLNYEYLGYFPGTKIFQNMHKQFYDPLWTVQRISESKLLLTSTFHGVMMALMTKTPFIAILNPNLEARLRSPVSDTFGSFRLLNEKELMAIGQDDLKKYYQLDDFNEYALNQYIDASRNWLATELLKK